MQFILVLYPHFRSYLCLAVKKVFISGVLSEPDEWIINNHYKRQMTSVTLKNQNNTSNIGYVKVLRHCYAILKSPYWLFSVYFYAWQRCTWSCLPTCAHKSRMKTCTSVAAVAIKRLGDGRPWSYATCLFIQLSAAECCNPHLEKHLPLCSYASPHAHADGWHQCACMSAATHAIFKFQLSKRSIFFPPILACTVYCQTHH